MEITGTVDLNGTTQSGITVVVDSVDDTTPSASFEAKTTTDTNGDYSFTVPDGATYHVDARYDDGADKWAGKSQPYIG